ncbi:MAG: helix-turn-helix domain-containing protein [Bacteroidota bacterium]
MSVSKTKYQIAQELGVSLRTLQRWIKKSDIEVPRGLVSPQKQNEIFEKLGYPFKKGTSKPKEV